jgi:predicted  nucleic acid-binding Zn-ribbon protein
MADVASIPLEQLQLAKQKIQSLMDHAHAIIMQAQSANDDLIQGQSLAGAAGVASAAKAAEITQAGEQLKNSIMHLAENLGIASLQWESQATDAAQLIAGTDVGGQLT